MKAYALMGAFVVSLVGLSYVGAPRLTTIEYGVPPSGETLAIRTEKLEPPLPEAPPDTRPVVRHVPIPDVVRAAYMSSCVVGTRDFRERLVALIEETELNALIIDIKDFSGTISFPPESDAWKPAWQAASCGAYDMRAFIETLHDKNIFVIGRITVFQDPFYALKRPDLAVSKASDGSVWHDHKGLSFIDVGAHEYWDHIALLARDAYNIGFDELNFDYVRYPSDGNMRDIAFPRSSAGPFGSDKPANLEAFFKHLHTTLSNEAFFNTVRHTNTGRASSTPWTSVDLFGMTTTNTDDLSIGQVLERAAPYFDFIAPMVYPSHYPNGFLGLGNPNDHPYAIVHHAMKSGVLRMEATTTSVAGFAHERIGTSTPPRYSKPAYPRTALRTWIQDFDYGGDYDAADVRAQIQASEDAGVMSYMLWAPSNIYTKAALRTE